MPTQNDSSAGTLPGDGSRIRFAFENSESICLRLNAMGAIIDASASACRILDCARNDIVGRHICDIQTSRDHAEWVQLMSSGDTVPNERAIDDYRRLDGETIKAHTSILLTTEAGSTFAYLAAEPCAPDGTISAQSIEERRLRQAIRVGNIGVFDRDLESGYVYWGPELRRIYGVSEDDPAPLSKFVDNIHPADAERVNALRDAALDPDGPGGFDCDLRWRRDEGDIRWLTIRSETIFTGEGENRRAARTIGAVLDVTERKKAENELWKLSRAVDASSSSMTMTDRNGLIEYVNPKFTEMTGYSSDEAVGQHMNFIRSDEIPRTVLNELLETVNAGGVWKGELHDRRKDGSLFWDRVSITGVKNEIGDITHFISNQEDVTHEYELSEQISYHASHDGLTGLVNRREFERRAERVLTAVRSERTEHALCFMDLDQFKVVNDTAGHMAGDEMLRQLSAVLQGAVRKRDTLARLGGDEFGILMEHCSPDHARRVATTLLEAIKGYQFSWEGHVFKVSVSIGLVAITPACPNLTELLKQADAACYMAKENGRNRVHVYQDNDASMAQRHGEMQWVTRIHSALEDHRFHLYAQPIEPLDSSHHKHYELLLRMEDEAGQLILPGVFLPAAERYNLIEQLDTWVVENAFTLLAANPAFLKQIKFVSINLSGQSLTKLGFLDHILSVLDSSGIEANKLCFEITETGAITNLIAASEFISTLKDAGCQFALDDFGSGFSSFGYLKTLAVDYLKIDGMFVRDIVDDPIDRAMVKSINEVGHVMGMQTIAEFVENDEIKGMLAEIGVNCAQGYAIGEPQSFVQLLETSTDDSV